MFNQGLTTLLWISITLVSSQVPCGIKPRQPHVIGGNNSKAGSWPWQVALMFYDQYMYDYVHVCGGVLVSDKFFVTAAHCVDPNVGGRGRDDPVQYRAIVGANSLSQTTGNEQVKKIDYIIRHEKWMPDPIKGFPNDIAVIRIHGKVDLTKAGVRTACIPSDYMDFTGDKCWITGWGLSSVHPEAHPDVLQEAAATIPSNAECQASIPYGVGDNHICFGGNTQVSSCDGDSGSPMSCTYNNVWYVAGVSSWVYNNCMGHPAVYTRISKYKDWIERLIEK